MPFRDIARTFTDLGGEFLLPPADMAEKLAGIRAFLFDWDGVFNPGIKAEGSGSGYSEPDSMGTNLLRFGGWLRTGRLPWVAIVTGANNATALTLAQRESFNAVYTDIRHKATVLDHLRQAYGLMPEEIAFVFDDVLDFSLAQRCGLRLLVRRGASPLTTAYVRSQRLADYVTGQTGGQHAVREVCELLLGLLWQFEAVVSKRTAWDDDYRRYLAERNAGQPDLFAWREGLIERVEGIS